MMKHWIRFFCLSLLSIVAGMASAQTTVNVATQDELASAVSSAAAGSTISIIAAGSYTMPNLPQNITIEGTVDGVEFNHTGSGNVANVPKGATFKNVAFNFGNENYHGFQAAGTINMEGCTINGKLFSYGDMNFTNCQFKKAEADYNMWCYGGDIYFKGCTFERSQKGHLHLYNEGNGAHKVTVEECNFINNGDANKAAINVKATCGSELLAYDVIINNCTTEGVFPEASESQALVVLNNLVQVDDRTANGVDNITVTMDEKLIYPAKYVAQIGTTKYETLEAAFAAAQDGETVTLLADIDATEQIEVGKQVTLDLNGKTIEYKGETTLTSGVIMVLRGGDLTVTDSSEGATGAIKSGTKAYAAIALTKKGETSTETAKLTVNNGTIEGYYYAIVGNGTRHGTDITIAGGTVKGTNEEGNQGIYHPQDGTLTISGGTISGYSSAVELRSGTLNITGGTLSASCTEFNYEPNNSGTTTDGAVIAIAQHSTLKAINVSIAGATLNGAKTIAVTDAQNNNLKDITVSVADGLTEKAYIPEGFKWVSADGMSTLTKKEYVAQVGDVQYETLKEALDAAKDNEDIVVELLADATLDVTAWSGTKNPLAIGTESTKSITINGNSHTLTFNQKNSDWNNVATMNDAETKLILNDMALTSSGYNNGPWNRHDINFNCAVELNSVTSDKALAFKNDATLKNVTVTDESGSVYGIWVQPNGQNISIDGLNVTAERGIKIDEQYVNDPEKVTLDIAHATFNTTKKAGVLVKSKGGAEISVGEGINIENVAADKENLVWVDEASATEFYKVTVAGATVVPESKVSDYVACVMNGEQSWGFYKKLSDAVNNVEEGYSIKLHQTTAEAVEVSKALTITKNGFTADNVTAGEGFKKFETETEIVIKAFNPVCAIGDEKYESLQEAVNAAGTNAATITLLTDAATDGVITGNGVKVQAGQNITFDLKDLTYNVDKTVGSAGTETNGFQLLKGSTVKFTNGTLTSATAKILLQNYSDLTLDGVTVNAGSANYAVSNNFGSLTVTGETNINAKSGGCAFDLWYGMSRVYDDGISIVFDENFTGSVTGKVEYGHHSSATNEDWRDKTKLEIKAGKFDIEFVNSSTDALNGANIQISGGIYSQKPDEKYCAEGYIVTDNTDEATKAQYPFAVKTKEEAGIYELIDGTPYPESLRANGGHAKEVTYTHKFAGAVYSCWWVPFNYTISDEDAAKFDFYTIHMIAGAKAAGEIEETGKIWIYLSKQESGKLLKSGHVYVIKPKPEEDVKSYTFKATDVDLLSENSMTSRKHTETSDYAYDFYGTYVGYTTTKPNDVMWLSKSGTIDWNLSSGAKLGSYRWFIRVTSKTGSDDADAKISIGFKEDDVETDGISNAQTVVGEIEGIYTLGGIKVEHPIKGVNIIKYTDGRTKKINVK